MVMVTSCAIAERPATMRKKYMLWILLFGGLWGLSEALLGGWMYGAGMRQAAAVVLAAIAFGLLYAVVDAAADEHLHDALLVERAQRAGAQFDPDGAVLLWNEQPFGDQVGALYALGLVLGVTDMVSGQPLFPCDPANSGHVESPVVNWRR